MWIGESGRKARHVQCCNHYCGCKRFSYKSPKSASLMAQQRQDSAVDRLGLIRAQLGIKAE